MCNMSPTATATLPSGPSQATTGTQKHLQESRGRGYEAEAEADPLMSTVKASHSGAMQHEILLGISIDC